jgi:hypothetical protein
MFGFKLTSLYLPYLFMEKLMPEAEDEEIALLYEQAKSNYRRYKLTGDITALNPEIELVDSMLPSSPDTQIST